MFKMLHFAWKGYKEAMAMQNAETAAAIMEKAAAGDTESQRICIDCYCDMSEKIPKIAMQALRAASFGGSADADGLLASSLSRGEETGKPDLEGAMALNLRSIENGSFVGAVNLAIMFAVGDNMPQNRLKSLEYAGLALKRLTEQTTTREQSSRKIVQFARSRIEQVMSGALEREAARIEPKLF